MSAKMKVGLIGCGNISPAYLKAAKTFKFMEISKCADVNHSAAEARAKEFELEAVSVDKLLADPEIKIILNLTIPKAHTEVNLKALNAGKHVHCEKPLAITREDGKKVVELAKRKKLLVGCAPDTFLGGGIQTCRKLIDDGWIGKPVAGTAFMMCHGHESWHPNAGFYYQTGGGPMLDMGPYYISALVNLLGPVKRTCACTFRAYAERFATCKELYGQMLPVEVETHQAGVLEFVNGSVITVVMSFDVWKHDHSNIEIYGTAGSLKVPDPNGFGGPVKLSKPGADWQEIPLSHGYAENMRSIGVADMVKAIQKRRINRCSGDFAYHVLDVMLSFEESSKSGKHVILKSTCKKPEALPLGLQKGELD
ncbi:MAG: Gfo/Idh/MocA family oxidoreductase [Lentisphaerota bacterium]